ncbi:hypothetical protein AMTRI_Chr13g83340 [Amborella trichopoda]|uniref:Phosphoglycerate mutase family protein n=1 Tax=Amborella trichopoda TaxID=13333 RepID=W1NST7_AMBTC|nr:uncharacterized protein LOC18428212 [Amborella trichopoda]ERN00167.1 hypothetical protein AMTR_s00111p00064560 [Amborella trichopoda]|eukprot:XP_006837313.1 uncharacterized protein LOC18428212 [Amborella trichopoda]
MDHAKTLTLEQTISPQNTSYTEKTLTPGHDRPVQNIIVMRHGDRVDQVKPLWIHNAQRPWDPPLVDEGKIRAWCKGKRLRNEGFQIHRVLVSPFVRCIETASEAIAALCAHEEHLVETTSENAVIDPTKVKVSIEYGLCEALCRLAINPEVVPKDGKWFPDVSELEALLPQGTVDRSVERVYPELPQWEEEMEEARDRYRRVIQALADKFPNENLLLVTHGEGVGTAILEFSKKPAVVYQVDYCAFAHLQRSASSLDDFEVLTKNGQTGISCYYVD